MAISPQDVSVQLRYLKRCKIYDVLRPYTLACKVDDEFPTNNLVFEYGPHERITDLRGLPPGRVTIDKNGLKLVQKDFKQPTTNDETITRSGGYLDEVRQVVKDALLEEGIKAERVEIVNWVFRSAANPNLFENVDLTKHDPKGFAPDTYVHNDCNYYGGDKRVRAVLGSEAEEILQSKRVRLINVWKPRNHPVEDCSLAICDASTVQHDKCIHGDFIISTDYISQTNYAAPCKEQVWYWVSNQQPNEALLFKQHDTNEASNTRYCPHTAFWKNDPRSCSRPRESIEVRVLVVSNE